MQRRGKRIAAIDGLIAATALENGLTVVTRDVGDFDGAGAPILNPREDAVSYRGCGRHSIKQILAPLLVGLAQQAHQMPAGMQTERPRLP